MTLEQRQRASHAFWSEKEAADDQVQASLLIAQQKKFRPKTVASLDLDRKARHLASLVALPDTLAARALIVYHLAEQRGMMSAFLDALGIKHENGGQREAGDGEAGAGRRQADSGIPGRRRASLSENAGLPGSPNMGRAQGTNG